MLIGIVGSGKLAKALFHDLPQIDRNVQVEAWQTSLECDIVIHAGSGRQWQDVVSFCQTKTTPLIQVATPKDIKPPESPSFAYVNAPNLSLPIVKFTHLLSQIKTLFPQAQKELFESHQASKTTPAATADRIAESVGLDQSSVQHIRDVDVQKDLGIPEEHLAHHALHMLTVEEDDATLTFSTNVYGALTYSIGAAKIAKAALSLEPGVFDVMDLIEKGLLLGSNALADKR